ncbi:MAG TPA: TetR/AcrR family transcriptional regulator [Candidatus Sulfotelmatobacter sp.]|nr:TetR/AcrR family transcriptional regulator [Candidatus Sulfotelmatobacter sp.]
MTLARPREAALHEAATRLFRQRGFHATSMQDLAEDLGMNRGSLYHYIDAKDDLLWTIVSGAMTRLDASVRPILESADPVPDRLAGAIAAHLAFAAAHGDELALVQIELRALPAERRAALVAQRDAYEAAWREAIRHGVADGSLRAVDVRLASIAILSVCNWFTQWYRPDGALGVPAVGREFAGLFLDGLREAGR